MNLHVLNIKQANAKHEERQRQIQRECEELAAIINEAIAAVDADSKNSWALGTAATTRVAYVDVGAYLPATVKATAQSYKEAGYVVNTMSVASATPAEDPMVMLAVVWGVDVMDEFFQEYYAEALVAGDEEEGAAPYAAEEPDAPESTAWPAEEGAEEGEGEGIPAEGDAEEGSFPGEPEPGAASEGDVGEGDDGEAGDASTPYPVGGQDGFGQQFGAEF